MAFEIKSGKKESENKTIRFPISLINKINNAIQNKDTSFSGFVIQACEYALDNMDGTGLDSCKMQCNMQFCLQCIFIFLWVLQYACRDVFCYIV